MKRSWKPAIAALVAAGALIAVSNTHAVETSNNIYQASEEYRVGAFSSVPQIDLNCKALHPELDSFDIVGKCMDHNWRKVLGTPLPEEELPMFCYPTGCRLHRARYSDAPLAQCYGFVVKNERGDSIYVSCRLSLLIANMPVTET